MAIQVHVFRVNQETSINDGVATKKYREPPIIVRAVTIGVAPYGFCPDSVDS